MIGLVANISEYFTVKEAHNAFDHEIVLRKFPF